MAFFNRAIKSNYITGFEKVSEKEVLLNCNPPILDAKINELKDKGFVVSLTPV